MTGYDRIIIGSGVAGLSAALALARQGRTLLLTKDDLEETATRYAQGGIAAAIGADDSAEAHRQDTIAAGAGLTDEYSARLLTDAAAGRIADLVALGVPFDREDGEIALGREAAHSAARIVHAGGDATGFHLEHTLAQRIQVSPVEVRQRAIVTRIRIEHGRVAGVDVLDEATGREQRVDAPSVIVATGGAGRLYCYTTNPPVATGDGIALAYRAGAAVMDLEFIQFHPTALRLPGVPAVLVTEAVRGEGALLRDVNGHAFAAEYDPRGELAPRDVVARAIWSQMERTGADHVYLDLRHLNAERVRARFPQFARVGSEHGLDISRDLVPVAPAAHYTMGGISTNGWGESSLPGLYACGEAACTSVHGANRLASNSLLEGLVFGARVAARTLAREPWPAAEIGAQDLPAASPNEGAQLRSIEELQDLMWERVGLVRDRAGLAFAGEALAAWQRALPMPATRAEHETANLLLVARLVAEAAAQRRESRGAHYRADFPEPSPEGLRHRIFQQRSVAAPAPERAAVEGICHAAQP